MKRETIKRIKDCEKANALEFGTLLTGAAGDLLKAAGARSDEESDQYIVLAIARLVTYLEHQ